MSSTGVELRGVVPDQFKPILTPSALDFVIQLHHKFYSKREQLLESRKYIQENINNGVRPDFLEETADIRNDLQWSVPMPPKDLEKRWVEITGPAGDRKMVINAFNSGADVYMADFEDSQSPTWLGLLGGQFNLYEAVRRTISFDHPRKGKIGLSDKSATLMVRPRGWHLLEKHLLVDGKPVSASIFDFGLFFYHNAAELLKAGSGPYFYLAKLENYLEASLWNDIFIESEGYLGIQSGSIRATVLIESILSVFQAEEILWALREHSAGENVGRWDYIASFGKKFRNDKEFILPDRGSITMTRHFLKSYVDYVIKVCHKRSAHAIGGMAAQIPIKDNPRANEEALAKVRADKEREVKAGHDGTWVAHPDLVPIAREVFEKHFGDKSNQINVKRDEVITMAGDLLVVPRGEITEEGLRENINAFIKYVAGWLSGTGAVAIDYHNNSGQLYAYLMEDAATAEIARTQVWKWVDQGARLDDGRMITLQLVQQMVAEEVDKIMKVIGVDQLIRSNYMLAVAEFYRLVTDTSGDFVEYLTLPAYELLLSLGEEKDEGGHGA